MRGDFTRDSFDRLRHYSRVAMQQGRVQLDADWNEQASIGQHQLRTLARDLIGPHGGPADDCGFGIVTDAGQLDAMVDAYGLPLDAARKDELRKRMAGGDFVIGTGRYYVDGLLCENDEPITYTEQGGYPFDPSMELDKLRGVKQFLIYLDVWERHLCAVEDPSLVEVALGGLDTATRVQLVWQVKVYRGDGPQQCGGVDALRRTALPRLRARAVQPAEDVDPCVIDPQARYRGAENQLYRVEIHRGGRARDADAAEGGATFKWSRENGSVVFPVLRVSSDATAAQTTVELSSLGHDARTGLAVGDVVELVDDAYALRESADALFVVQDVDRDRMQVVLSGASAGDTGADPRRHPLLRRWDHGPALGRVGGDAMQGTAGALPVIEAAGPDQGWLELEDGVTVQFPASTVDGLPNEYRTGDYWLIPARTATGDVLWPRRMVDDELQPLPLPPAGVAHHYAPLAIATLGDGGELVVETPDCRSVFDTMPRVQRQ